MVPPTAPREVPLAKQKHDSGKKKADLRLKAKKAAAKTKGRDKRGGGGKSGGR